MLDRFGLSFDAWLYHTQLQELVDLARTFPNVTIIVDHIAGPIGIGPYAGSQDEVFSDWSTGINELATCENVVMKVGGFGMPLSGLGWGERNTPASSEELATAMAPFYDHCIEAFDPDRCMFESNFPVDKQSTSYTILWNTFKRIAEGYSASEKASLFRNTARRTYRI